MSLRRCGVAVTCWTQNVSWSGERTSDEQDAGRRPAGVGDAPGPACGPRSAERRVASHYTANWHLGRSSQHLLGMGRGRGSGRANRPRGPHRAQSALSAVMPFDNLSEDAQQEYFATA
jgi:hypothetical protein